MGISLRKYLGQLLSTYLYPFDCSCLCLKKNKGQNNKTPQVSHAKKVWVTLKANDQWSYTQVNIMDKFIIMNVHDVTPEKTPNVHTNKAKTKMGTYVG